jgi:hypothetical protein
MIGPLLTQLLGQTLLEGPRRAVETAKTRIVFAGFAAAAGIAALVFLLYAAYLWFGLRYGPLAAAAIMGGILAIVTGGCAAVVCWPPRSEPLPPPPPPETQAVAAMEQLSHALGDLSRGKNGGLMMLGILAGVTALGFGLGKKG